MTRLGKLLVLLVCLCVCLGAALASKQLGKASDSDVSSLQELVVRHITALRTSEYAEAYTQTSRAIKVRYDIDAFKGMLHHHYVPVFSARRVEIGEARVRGGYASVTAYLIDEMDRITPCTYHLLREQGAWRISGVFIQPTWPSDVRLCGIRA